MKIKWSPRLKKEKLTRLYKLNAMQIIDHDLLQDVAFTLYMRCKDIIAIYDAHYNQRVRCPLCYDSGNENYIDFPKGLKAKIKNEYVFSCPFCGGAFSWADFRQSHSRRQLNIGGAGAVFRRFISQYERKPDDNALMLEVDRLIHEFHYSLKADGTQQAHRIAAANLIDINATHDTIAFLDDLSNNTGDDERLKETAQEWRKNVSRYHDFEEI